MGNNQSSTEQNRLSKPKTNKYSLRASSHTDSPISVTTRFSDLSTSDRQHIKATLLSPVETSVEPTHEHGVTNESRTSFSRERGRRWSFSSQTRSRIRSRSNSLSCLGDRSQLGDFQSSRISLSHDQQSDVENAIKILKQARRNGSPEEIAALDIALSAVEPAMPPTQADPNRSHNVYDNSSTPFTRRRSIIQTPGVGMRSSLDNHRKTWNSWQAPKLDPEEEAKWNTTPRYRTPRDPVANRRPVGNGRESPTHRAQTPNDMDYSHLGSLKLGSLVVVNGVPSPALSNRTPLAPRNVDNADYFSARGVGSSPLAAGEKRIRGHAKSKSFVLPRTPSIFDVDRGQDRENTRQSDQNAAYRSSTLAPRSPRSSPGLAPEAAFHTQVARVDLRAASAYDLATAYQADIPKSPFAIKYDSPSVERNSASQVESECFVKAGANRILEGTIFHGTSQRQEQSDHVHTSVGPHTSDRSAGEASVHRAKQRPSARTYDSGYSSGGSLRLTNSNIIQNEMKAAQLQKTVPSSSNDDWQHSERNLLMKPKPQANSAPSIEIPNSARRISQSETALSPTTPRSITSQTSLDSTNSVTHRTLQKRRSSKTELLHVRNNQPDMDSTIPEIPENVRANLSRHAAQHHGRDDSSSAKLLSENQASNQARDELLVQPAFHQHYRPSFDNANTQRPQQPSGALPRTKSLVHMSHMESVAQTPGAQMYENQTYWHGESRRRKSHHNLKIHTNDTRHADARPQTAGQNIPPVPSNSMIHSPALFSARPRLEGNTQDVRKAHFHPKAQPDEYDLVQPQRGSHYDSHEYSDRTLQNATEGQSFSRNMRRKSMGEGLRTHGSSNQTLSSRNHSRTKSTNPDDTAAWGRYSGGLQYGYEGRAYGIGGSAGTRQLHSQASLKSTQWRKYGVDLSDVPVFLQKT